LLGGAHAAELNGTVFDSETDQPVVGANLFLDRTSHGAFSDSAGRFKIMNVPRGRYTLTASHVGYTIRKRRVVVATNLLDAYDDAIGISGHVVIILAPEVLSSQSVVVTATRAKAGETPVTFSNISRETISRDYYSQDVPMLLQSTPSAYAYSDAGNGVGYSYLKIRGFDQSRINVLINGIPHNGPTSHELYWIDLPDILESAADIQVQRGVGSSLYGSAAFGGTVNIITTTYNTEPSISVYTDFGSYNTQKQGFAFSSGLVDDSYVMYGRFSRISSDGYRDQSWTRVWSYFLGVARYDEDMTTRVQLYGGPEETHLSYYGVEREYIDSHVSADVRRTRRHNPLTYEHEIDAFNQPHYEVHHEWRIQDDLTMNSIAYTIKGKGHYDQFRTSRKLSDFGLPSIEVRDPDLYPAGWYKQTSDGLPLVDHKGDYAIVRSDLIKSRWVQNNEYGFLPRLNWRHGRNNVTLGAEVRLHSGRHWGQIAWLGAVPPNVGPDHVYYSYLEKKRTLSLYAQELYQLTPDVALMADMQAVTHTYSLQDDTVSRYTYTVPYRWLAPRGGVNVNLTEHVQLFASVAYAKREPPTSNLVNPQDYFTGVEPNFEKATTDADGDVHLSRPTVKPESMTDWELGLGYSSATLSAKANVYYMDFRNEIVPWVGQISEASGLPITGNAERSVHQGIELEALWRPVAFAEIGGNLNVNDDHFDEYVEYVADWGSDAWPPPFVTADRKGKRIAGSAAVLANVQTLFRYGGLSAGIQYRYVGRQYLDNSENQDNSLNPYSVIDIPVAYRFSEGTAAAGLEVRFRMNNVLDRLYEAGGYVDDVYVDTENGTIHATPYYIPAATRNWMMSIRWEM
jgi:iron complex outermembrane recepter protein